MATGSLKVNCLVEDTGEVSLVSVGEIAVKQGTENE